ncbi:MAG: hypothetical protein PHN59_01245 [Candidatus Omnitrophica bacterium]|nr:hypothetical protein [Candidatus Omnitrophota bacterium]
MKLKKIALPFKVNKPILAFGAAAKNTLCFAKRGFAYLSPVHTDLSQPCDFSIFENEAKSFLRRKPKIIAYDLHPDYPSSKFALALDPARFNLFPVQHHHAHIASCMAENGLVNQKVIGVAFDGTGMGSDNSIWGAEFLICDYGNYQRRAHLKEIPLLGAEKAIQQPWRLACAWLDFQFFPRQYQRQCRILKKIARQKFHFPMASSMGRLFDAVGSLVLKKYQVKQEAELAIALEKIASRYKAPGKPYNFKILNKQNQYIIDPGLMFRQVLADLKAKTAKEKIAYRFHHTIAKMIAETCLILRKNSGINRVALSGGVFQNKLLLALSLELLCNAGFKVVIHKDLSSSDASISLGQAAVANFFRR